MRSSRHGAAPERGRARGFTLIELMIVVAVIAVLAAIAIPSYQDSVRKGRRGDAKAVLVQAAQVLERFHTVNNTYVGATGVPTQSPDAGTAAYAIAVTSAANTYSIRATPVSGTGQERDSCGILTVDQTGKKMHSRGTDAECGFGSVGP